MTFAEVYATYFIAHLIYGMVIFFVSKRIFRFSETECRWITTMALSGGALLIIIGR